LYKINNVLGDYLLICEEIALNQKFENSHYHHLNLPTDKRICLYIPKEIHFKFWHSSYKFEKMRDINKAALLWLALQSVIIGSNGSINPDIDVDNTSYPNDYETKEFNFPKRLKNDFEQMETNDGVTALVNYNRVHTVHGNYISRITMNNDFSSILPFDNSILLEAYYDKEKRELIIRERKKD